MLKIGKLVNHTDGVVLCVGGGCFSLSRFGNCELMQELIRRLIPTLTTHYNILNYIFYVI